MLGACAALMNNVKIVGEIDLGDNLAAVIGKAKAVIDFSSHDATPSVAALCARHKKALVIGTTGHSDAERSRIAKFTSRIPIVWSANYATGVNALFWLARKAVEILGPEFDLEVVEMHHRMKKDAPSGTAQTLAEILAGTRKWKLAQVARHGRSGMVGPRPSTEIGVHSLRGGDVVGDHTVILVAEGERLELTHRASSRASFAQGALRSAVWAVKQKPGLYDMGDVLGLK